MSLAEKRKEIDKVDLKILELLKARVNLAKDIGKVKAKGKGDIFVPSREKEIINNLLKKNKGSVPEECISGVYGEIFSACRNIESPLKIAYLGPKATFTHIAAIKQFGSSPEFIAKDSISEVFSDVEKKVVSYGVVPIENSQEGTVTHTLDMFLKYDIDIVSERMLEVKHHLLSNHGVKEIKKIYTHPHAMAQCRNWIAKNLPKAELIEVSSTTKGAESASLYHSSAAIASELAAKEYALGIIARNIEDSGKNHTRFLIIGESKPKNTGKDKTSMVFSVKHESGALFSALKSFQDYGVNMTKIESRPTKLKNWNYVFFVDVQGYIDDEKIKKALKDMEKSTGFIKILGSYPEENNK